jgi:hypothetical protein
MEGRALFFDLFNPEGIRLVKARCVPFTRNYLVPSGYAGDEKFFQKLEAGGARLGNSWFLCTASGKVLGTNDFALRQWLAAWDNLPEAERRPGAVNIEDRGPFDPKNVPPQPPPGALILKVYSRGLERDTTGQLYAPQAFRVGVSKTMIKAEPQRDFLWLTEAEWRSLIPPQPIAGMSFPVPVSIRNRICRFHLANMTLGFAPLWSREEIRFAEFTLTIYHVSSSSICLRLDGAAQLASAPNITKAKRGYDVALLGFLEYNVPNKSFRRFDIVAVGDDWGSFASYGLDRRYPLGFAFELPRNEAPNQLRPPRGTHDYGLAGYLNTGN